MPPQLALILSTLFTLMLFLAERRRVPRMSGALWVPLIWHFILATRSLSVLFSPTASEVSPEAYLEGSPFDRAVFLLLILAALVILLKRSASLPRIFANNPWLVLFLVYCGISTLWSDYPYVSFKRWTKDVGNVAMVLVVMTDANPVEAIKTLFRRIAYLAVPLSIVFIKYFGDLGRQFSRSGEMMFVGATTHKNSLGILCAILIIMFVWHLMHTPRPSTQWERRDRRIHILLLLMMVWLIYISNSATSVMCCIIGLAVVFGMELPVMQRNYRHIGTMVVSLLVIGFLLQYSLDIWQVILTSLGRDATLTGRTVLWEQVLAMGTNPVIGTGYDSFWLGQRVEMFWEMYFWKPNQAHNGFLEIYLNLGWIGVLLLTGIIISTYRKIASRMVQHDPYQILRMSFYVVVLVSNLTEAYFKNIAEVWFVFLLISIEYPRQVRKAAQEVPSAVVRQVSWN